MRTARTSPTGRHYDRLAGIYDLLDLVPEALWYRHWRRRICSDLEGRVLDLGTGTGKNLPWFPPGARVEAVDASRGMLARAARRAARARCPVSLHQAAGHALPFPPGSMDAVVATFYLCVVDRPQEAAREIARVLRPGGQAITLDFVYARGNLPERLVWRLTSWIYRPDPLRDPAVLLRGAGLRIEKTEQPGGPSTVLLRARA